MNNVSEENLKNDLSPLFLDPRFVTNWLANWRDTFFQLRDKYKIRTVSKYEGVRVFEDFRTDVFSFIFEYSTKEGDRVRIIYNLSEFLFKDIEVSFPINNVVSDSIEFSTNGSSSRPTLEKKQKEYASLFYEKIEAYLKKVNDEFYTQFGDIQKEIQAYLDYNSDAFRNKVVYCNCDDPFESNFFRYFVLNFNKLGLKQLITTSYKPSPVANTQLGLFGDDKTLSKSKGRPKVNANKFIINEVHDIDGDGEFNLKDIAKQLKANKHNEWTPLEGDGDFRSDECINLLKQSDIVVTNPPFSLFREYIKQLVDYHKKFLIIGNLNAITYKEVFPLIKENKVWLGNNYKVNAGAMFFEIG